MTASTRAPSTKKALLGLGACAALVASCCGGFGIGKTGSSQAVPKIRVVVQVTVTPTPVPAAPLLPLVPPTGSAVRPAAPTPAPAAPKPVVRKPAVPKPAAPRPKPKPPAPKPPAAVYYANCSAARAAGAAPLYRGEPGYRPALDRDNDGIACEKR